MCNTLENLNEFFEVPMDGLLLCTMPTVRAEPIKRACDKKIHLLIEKPAAYNLPELSHSSLKMQIQLSAAAVCQSFLAS